MAILEDFILDPVKAQNEVINRIESDSGSVVSTVDPTNPFIMSLETSVITSTNAVNEMLNNNRKIYPSLARTAEDLYHHVSEIDEENLFATPATTEFTFLINKKDFLALAINTSLNVSTSSTAIDSVEFMLATLPKNTKITVNDIDFTLLDDVDIKYYDYTDEFSNKLFVEYQVTDETLMFKDTGILKSTMERDGNNADWIVFNAPVAQLTTSVFTTIITPGDIFKIEIPITDAYYYSFVEVEVNGVWERIEKTYSESIVNLDNPVMFIQVLDSSVLFKLPYIFVENETIRGNVRFTIYTTKGRIVSPLNKHLYSDFKLTTSPQTTTANASVTRDMNINVSCSHILDGGVNRRSVKDLRAKIINRTTGALNIPISEQQLIERALFYGFELIKNTDVITERIYTAHKDISKEGLTTLIPAISNVSMNAARIDLKLVVDEFYGTDIKHNITIANGDIMIKSNTIFKNDNGVVVPLSAIESNDLNNLDIDGKINFIKNDKFFFTPYYYFINNNENVLTSRVYTLDKPLLEHSVIHNKNTVFDGRSYIVDLKGYLAMKTTTGYDLYFQINRNTNAENIKNDLRVQVRLVSNNGSEMFFHSDEPVEITPQDTLFKDLAGEYIWKISITTDFYINNDHELVVTNGESKAHVRNIILEQNMEVLIYEIGSGNTDGFLESIDSMLYKESGPVVGIGLTKQTLDITLGTHHANLWNKSILIYDKRQYLKYTSDVIKVYLEDVYEINPENNSEIFLVDSNNDGVYDDIERRIIHYAGDNVLDGDGEVILLHRAGDPIVDYKTGLPTILDDTAIHISDILMLDYEFKILNKSIYNDHIEEVKDNLHEFINIGTPELNERALEHTSVCYTSIRNINPVELINGTTEAYLIRPKVKLYVSAITNSQLDKTSLKETIGTILSEYFSGVKIDIDEIKQSIKDSIGDDVHGVKIFNYSSTDPVILSLKNSSNRFAITKTITNAYSVTYDFDLTVETI